MDQKTKAALGLPGSVTVGDKVFVIPQPTPGDSGRVHVEMLRLASAGIKSPILAVAEDAPHLPPGVLQAAVQAAVAIKAAGPVSPSEFAVNEAYRSAEGVRFRLWYFARKADPTLTKKGIEALVTDENVYEVIDALEAALAEGDIDPEKKAGSGTPS